MCENKSGIERPTEIYQQYSKIKHKIFVYNINGNILFNTFARSVSATMTDQWELVTGILFREGTRDVSQVKL